MAPPPKTKTIGRESVPGAPGWFDAFLQILNTFMTDVAGALSRQLKRRENFYSGEREGIAFTTGGSDVAPVEVKWEVVARPRHVWVTKLAQADGNPLPIWSYSWTLDNRGQILVQFQGLSTAESYVFSLVYE